MPKFEIKISPLNIHANTPFRISRETKIEIPNVLLTLSANGFEAFGEAAPDYYYDEDRSKVIENLKQYLIPVIGDKLPETVEQIEQIWEIGFKTFKSRAALAAMDMALWDYASKKRNQPIWEFWGGTIKKEFQISCTIGLGPVEEMVEKIKDMQDYPIIKVKLGSNEDLKIIAALREHFQGKIRVDANCGWAPEKALEMINALAQYDIEMIEQPMAVEQTKAMEQLKLKSNIPLIADESCVVEKDIVSCAKGFDGINIKLVKCGGITPALRMVKQARGLGLKVMIGGMLETNVGVGAGLIIGGQADYIDLDCSWLLKDDPFEGHSLEKGVFKLLNKPGLGAVLRDG